MKKRLLAGVLMGLLANRLGFKAFSIEDPAQPLLPYSALFESLGLGRSDAGVMVNEKQAMRLTTAYGCINVISSDLSRLPLEVHQTLPDNSIRLASDHPNYPFLRIRGNPYMGSMIWRRAALASALAYGNGYVWIKRDRGGRTAGLIPLASDKTAPVKVNGEFLFATTQTDTGEAAKIDPMNMLHFRGLSFDGITGLSPIQTCKNAFGLGLAAEKFGAQLFGNGARTTGVLSHPDTLDEEARENLKKSVQEWASGETALRPIILEEGLKWQQISISPDDAQFLQTRKFQRSEVAALFRVPLHLLQDLERATNNNIEHQGEDYTRYCLSPWAVCIEEEINFKLLGGTYFAEHDMEELNRGDFASRTQGFQTLRNIGVVSANNIRRKLRMPPVPAEEGGDVLTVQGAMIPLSALVSPDESQPAEEEASGSAGSDPRRRQLTSQFTRLFRDAVGRVVNRESRDEQTVRRAFQPVTASLAEAVVAIRYGSMSLTNREKAVIDSQLQEIARCAPAWQKQDAGAIAARITGQVYDAFAQEVLV